MGDTLKVVCGWECLGCKSKQRYSISAAADSHEMRALRDRDFTEHAKICPDAKRMVLAGETPITVQGTHYVDANGDLVQPDYTIEVVRS